MIIRFPRDLGGILVGRDFMCDRDCRVGLYLLRRPDAQEGELVWRFVVEFSWNWLPTTYWRYSGLEPGIDSSAWTGREATFARFGRWQRSLWWSFQ